MALSAFAKVDGVTLLCNDTEIGLFSKNKHTSVNKTNRKSQDPPSQRLWKDSFTWMLTVDGSTVRMVDGIRYALYTRGIAITPLIPT